MIRWEKWDDNEMDIHHNNIFQLDDVMIYSIKCYPLLGISPTEITITIFHSVPCVLPSVWIWSQADALSLSISPYKLHSSPVKINTEHERLCMNVYFHNSSSYKAPLSNVKAGPQITPIIYVYLDVWERKYLHSPKIWECRTKTKQPNKFGSAHSFGPLSFIPPVGRASRQRIRLGCSEARHQHGKPSSERIHPGGNVSDDAILISLAQSMSVCPVPRTHQPTKQSHVGASYMLIFEMVVFLSTI